MFTSNYLRMVILSLALIVPCMGYLFPFGSVFGTTIGVVPFSSEGITEDESMVITKAVRDAIRKHGNSIASSKIMDALEEVGCDDSHQWGLSECVVAVGRKCGADYILGGTIQKIKSKCTVTPSLYDVKKRIRIWSAVYNIAGDSKDIYTKIPKKIATEIREPLRSPRSGDTRKKVTVTETTTVEKSDVEKPDTVTATDTATDTDTLVDMPQQAIPKPVIQPKKIDYGIVGGFTVSIGGHAAIMKTEREQTPGGFMLSLLYPTGEQSQVRIRAGLPLFRNAGNSRYINNKQPDPMVSIEHDWSWKYFGVTAGLAYMNLQKFTKVDFWDYYAVGDPVDVYTYDYYRVKTTEKYSRKNSLNASVGFRGGMASRGFYGCFSWPFAFNLKDNEPSNFFMEYSAFGVFGWKKNSFSIGIMGMHKRREPDPESIVQIGSPEQITAEEFEKHFYRDKNMSNELYLLFPCLRYARLIGERVIVGLSFELGGTILPRFMLPDFFGYEDDEYQDWDYVDDDLTDNNQWWKPSIGLQFVYSFAPLRGVHYFDGSL